MEYGTVYHLSLIHISANTKANGGDIVSYVGAQNFDVGYSLATALFEKLGGQGKVILIEGKAGNSTSEERAEGFKEALKEYPGIELLASQPADWDRASAMTVMENCLQTYDPVSYTHLGGPEGHLPGRTAAGGDCGGFGVT